MGGLYLFLNRLGDYEVLMQRLEHEASENLTLRIQFGHYLLLNRRYPDAERYLQHVLLEDPHNIKAHWYRARIHQARGRLGWAIREFHEALHADFCDKNIILDLSTGDTWRWERRRKHYSCLKNSVLTIPTMLRSIPCWQAPC